MYLNDLKMTMQWLKHVDTYVYIIINKVVFMVINNYFVIYATRRDKNFLWNILHWHLGSVNVPGVRLKLRTCESKILSISINYGISHNQDTLSNSMGYVSLYVRNDIRSNTLTY